MKRNLIASVVGGIILFFWQFLSNSVLNIHRPMMNYTAKQTEILDYLGKNLGEGHFYLPNTPDGTSMEESQKIMTTYMGKPFAQISYHNTSAEGMSTQMIRTIIIDILAVFLLVLVFSKMNYPSFTDILLSSLAIGFLSYLTTSYATSIWYETKSLPDLIEGTVSWGLVGAWLGWFLRR
jgi:hypothetical protein